MSTNARNTTNTTEWSQPHILSIRFGVCVVIRVAVADVTDVGGAGNSVNLSSALKTYTHAICAFASRFGVANIFEVDATLRREHCKSFVREAKSTNWYWPTVNVNVVFWLCFFIVDRTLANNRILPHYRCVGFLSERQNSTAWEGISSEQNCHCT